MTSRLLNVRLDPDRARKADELRTRGVTLSDVVREAIDRRFADLEPRAAGDVASLLRRMIELFPEPAGHQPREYDVHDPRAARAAIRRTLKSQAR